jgi:hypothetical protein
VQNVRKTIEETCRLSHEATAITDEQKGGAVWRTAVVSSQQAAGDWSASLFDAGAGARGWYETCGGS